MKRYVLLNDGPGDASAVLAKIQTLPNLRLLDQTDDRALLIEGSSQSVGELKCGLEGWTVRRETTHPAPTPPFPRPGWKL